MKVNIVYVLFLCIVLLGCNKAKHGNVVYESEMLTVIKISEHTYQHISYFHIEGFGSFQGNGMIVSYNGEAVVFDTPGDDNTSAELIDWITNELNSRIIVVIPTHSHIDNLGGLNEFHKHGIASYAYNRTIELACKNNLPVPLYGFDEYMEFYVGDKIVRVEFLGEGHTIDNTIGYFPYENIMFGGCLIKEIGASKGNLEEANVEEWSNTVMEVKMKYPDVKKVIPGHGEIGGIELLNYTIDLFN